MAIDPVTTTLLVINGGLVLGNALLWMTDPSKTDKAIKRMKGEKIQRLEPEYTFPESFMELEQTSRPSEERDHGQHGLVMMTNRFEAPPAPQVAMQEATVKTPEPVLQLPSMDQLALTKLERRVDSVTTRINTVEERLSTEVEAIDDRLKETRTDVALFKQEFRAANVPRLQFRVDALDRAYYALRNSAPQASPAVAAVAKTAKKKERVLKAIKKVGKPKKARKAKKVKAAKKAARKKPKKLGTEAQYQRTGGKDVHYTETGQPFVKLGKKGARFIKKSEGFSKVEEKKEAQTKLPEPTKSKAAGNKDEVVLELKTSLKNLKEKLGSI